MQEMTGLREKLQSNEKVMKEEKAKKNDGIVLSGWFKDGAPKKIRAVSNMT